MNRWKLARVLGVMICLFASARAAFGLLVMFPAGSRLGGDPDHPKGWKSLLESEKSGRRVFGYWINGSEVHHFAGDADALSSFLKIAAELDVKKRTIVFRAGKGEAEHSELGAKGKERISCDWNVQLFAPIRKADDLTIEVFLGGGLDREKLHVPEGFDVVDRAKSKRK